MSKYKRPYRFKKKKSILRNRFFWLGILVLAAGGAAFYLLFFSEFFHVEKIAVRGQEKVSEGEIRSVAEKRLESRILFFKTKSIFAIDLGEIKKEILNRFPQVATVEVSRDLPDALSIRVSERQAVAVWCLQDCFFIDKEGAPFQRAPLETDLIKVSGEEKLLGEIGRILEVKSKLKEELGIEIGKAELVSSQRLNVETLEGWEIYFDLKGDFGWQIQKLGLVLEKQIPPEKRGSLEYVDLRFSRVYYK